MILLLIAACAQQDTGTPDNQGNNNQQQGEEEPCTTGCEDNQLYDNWDEALKALGYNPWYSSIEDQDQRPSFTPDCDFDQTDRPFFAIRWEADNELGYEVSGANAEELADVNGWHQTFWVCTFDGSKDPFQDPDCAQGLEERGTFSDNEDYHFYYDVVGDGLYVPEEDTE